MLRSRFNETKTLSTLVILLHLGVNCLELQGEREVEARGKGEAELKAH